MRGYLGPSQPLLPVFTNHSTHLILVLLMQLINARPITPPSQAVVYAPTKIGA